MRLQRRRIEVHVRNQSERGVLTFARFQNINNLPPLIHMVVQILSAISSPQRSQMSRDLVPAYGAVLPFPSRGSRRRQVRLCNWEPGLDGNMNISHANSQMKHRRDYASIKHLVLWVIRELSLISERMAGTRRPESKRIGKVLPRVLSSMIA